MRKLLLFFAALSVTMSLKSQVWQPVGGGLDIDSTVTLNVASVHHNGDIYVSYTRQLGGGPNTIWETTVEVWNGVSWNKLPIVPSNYLDVEDITFFGDTLYIVGHRINSSTTSILYSFYGNQWTQHTTPGSFSGTAYFIMQYNNALLVGGQFTMGTIGENLVVYDGYSFQPLFGDSLGKNFNFNNAIVLGGDLYVGLNSASGDTNVVRKYDIASNKWISPAHHFKGITFNSSSYKVYKFQNKLYASETSNGGGNQLFEVKEDTLHYLGKIQHRISDFDTINGVAYFVGDTLSGANNITLTRFDGVMLTPIASTPRQLEQIEVIDTIMYGFSAETKYYNGIDYSYTFKSAIGNFSLLNGKIFNDANENCVYEITEDLLKNITCNLDGNIVSTNEYGEYAIAIPPGSYNLGLVDIVNGGGKNYSSPCNSAPVSLGINQTQLHDIALVNKIPIDGMVSFTPYRGFSARHGFTEHFKLDFSNAGNTTVSQADVEVEIPASLTYISGTPAPSSINGNILTYNFSNVAPGTSQSANLSIEVSTSTNNIGDSLVFLAKITNGLTGDADLSDNADTVHQVITAAVDPNDKQASAATILPGTKNVDYVIRFQNTGNDTAVKVTVVDTLDISLPLTQIVIKSASHPYLLRVENNVLIWEFNNIMLPDSTTNEAASQGFVRFSAGLNPSLNVGDTIFNDAEIYFDYQHPIHTGLAKTIIVETIGLNEIADKDYGISVYPNPAENYINIRNTENKIKMLELYSSNGKKVETVILNKMETKQYPVTDLPRGVYFLKGKNATFKILVQ